MANNCRKGRNAAERYGLLLDRKDEAVLATHYIIALKDSKGAPRPFARTKGAYPKAISLARLLLNPGRSEVVDHINGNPWDNRRHNLRVCTQAENLRNARVSSDHATGFKGVSANGRRFQAVIRGRYLGTFDTPQEAASAYDAAARRDFGTFAAVNFARDHEQSAHRRGASNV